MTEPWKDVVAVRAIRDSLRLELAKLDWLGEQLAAIELNSAVELLNTRLGEDGHPAEPERLLRRHFDNCRLASYSLPTQLLIPRPAPSARAINTLRQSLSSSARSPLPEPIPS